MDDFMEQKLTWKLSHILKKEDFESEYKSAENSISHLNKFYETLSPSMNGDEFREAILSIDGLAEKIARLTDMPALMVAADAQSKEGKSLQGRARELEIKYQAASIRLWNWIRGKESNYNGVLDEENAKRLFMQVPGLDYVLTHTREGAKYALGNEEESLSSTRNLYQIGRLLDQRNEIETGLAFQFIPRDADKPLTFGTIAGLMEYALSPHATDREGAYRTLLGRYKEKLGDFFSIYEEIVNNWHNETVNRGYPKPISIRNFSNHIPDKVVDELLVACRQNLGVFKDYLKFKAKKLGMEKLRRFDLYAPINAKKQEYIPFQEAKKMVLSAFSDFSESFANKAEQIFSEGHIDNLPREGKESISFCASVAPKITPYISLEYSGKKEDVMVLAYELGHGIHSLCCSHLPYLSYDATIPVTETAAIFAELLVFEKLLSNAKNDEERQMLLSNKISNSMDNILKGTILTDFEIMAHEAVISGKGAEEISGIYLDTFRSYLGDVLDIDPVFRYEWPYISYIYDSPFYCYAYSLEMLALKMYETYKQDSKRGAERIESFLSLGGSKSFNELLKEGGIEMPLAEALQSSLGIIRGWQDMLEKSS